MLSLFIVVPSIFSASILVQESIQKSSINQFVTNEFADYVVLNQSYNEDKELLTVTISGAPMPKSKVQIIQQDLPDYGLDKVTLDIDQVPDFTELKGSEVTKYIDQYIKKKLDEEDSKNVETHAE